MTDAFVGVWNDVLWEYFMCNSSNIKLLRPLVCQIVEQILTVVFVYAHLVVC